MLKASEEIGGKEQLPRARVDMINTKDETLDDFVNKSSRRLFPIVVVPDSFLEMDPETWNKS